jgi:PAS domain S-box-containing protein
MIFKLLFKKMFVDNSTVSLITVWSLLIAMSVSWNIYQNSKDTISKARIEARTIYQHNLAYRKWSTMHGGIYTRITNNNKSNPHFMLPMGSDAGAMAFSMIDPSQMTKQAYDVLHKQSPTPATINRTVSLDYQASMDPYDEPDTWERQGLTELHSEKVTEYSAVMNINNAVYLRLLKPYVIDKGCLKCHGSGYKVGEVRAGMSVAVPMRPYYDIESDTKKTIFLTHILLWLLGCFAISRFTAAFKQYRKTISENEEKFRIVSEFAYNFEYWIKADNSLAFISPSCERLTGYTREEFSANPKLLLDIIHQEDLESYRHHVAKINAPSCDGKEYRIITKNGEIRWFSHTCSPIHINGSFLGRRSSCVDITDHKELQDELQKAKQLEYLGQFAGGIAHDFNNVLGSINTFSHLISEEVKDSNKIALDYVKYIKIAAKLGKNMTSNLLSFGKRQVITPKKTTLNAIILNISDILRTLVDEEIGYDFNLDEQNLAVFADPHQIEQILINLCTNARDAMRQSGGKITITTKAAELPAPLKGVTTEVPAGQYMTMSVSDSGHGIDPEHLSKICEPFFTTKDASKGTGLGMSIILNIVKQHNAFLDINSTVGRGTTFTIYLPATKNMAEKSRTASQPDIDACETKKPAIIKKAPLNTPTTALNDASATDAKTILLVDDDELIRKSLSLPLERMGYKILCAENGRKAVSQYIDHKDKIDLIILDVILPYKNGKEVFDIIRKDNKNMNVIFISGYTDDILSEDTINEDGVYFLAKPIDFEEMIETIKSLIGS